MEETSKKGFELTKRGKIIISALAIIILSIIVIILIPRGKVEGISLEVAIPNEGKVVEDPILGTTLTLGIERKIQLNETIYPKTKSKTKIEYVVEDPSVAEINKDNQIVGMGEGTTKVYAQTKDGKVKSNEIEITVEK